MAKLIGPLMSIEASGSIAGTLTFAKTKGRAYVRQLVKPSNPRSAGQTSNRAMMGFLGQQWSVIDPGDQAMWQTLADITKISPFNAYVSENMNRWTQFLAPWQAPDSPETPPTNTWTTFTATGGVRQATITFEADVTVGAPWGVIIYRSTAAIVTPTKDMVVAVRRLQDAFEEIWIDTPLEPGTYHYRGQAFSPSGGKSLTIAADVAAVVT